MSRFSKQAERQRLGGYSLNAMLLTLLSVIAIAGVAWVYMGMTSLDRWPIRWLEVDGAFERVSAEQVRTRIAPLVDESYFTVDIGEVRQAVTGIAWVAAVDATKSWPDTVMIRVHEHVPVAHWTGGRLISPQGVAFVVPGADEIQGLPWLEGPEEGLHQVIESWQAFNNTLLPTGLEIELIRLDPRGSWYLELNNGTEVQLGRTDAGLRLKRMADSWPKLIGDGEMAPIMIDLRYSNGFAVRWPEPAADLADNRG